MWIVARIPTNPSFSFFYNNSMNPTKTKRIESLDVLKGLVMIIMALDHTRDYFHYDAFFYDPADPLQTDLALFFTRWISHFCAPAFAFLAGMSAFLVGRRKSKNELAAFLVKRGLWLVFIEFTLVCFGWRFNIHFPNISLQVIWVLGLSMILLAGIIYLPMRYILALSLAVIVGHNALDYLTVEDSVLWTILHEQGGFYLTSHTYLRIVYPLIPWFAIMSLGYYFGVYYDKAYDPIKRQRLFTRIGLLGITAFFILRFINQYGNPKHWDHYDTFLQTMYAFLDPSKYPPSLAYTLMTLGLTFLFLGTTENLKNKVTDFFSVFGKVPFFYYIIHLYVIHFFALLLAEITGFGWEPMILDGWITMSEELDGYGVSLGWVYLIWIAIVFLLYPLCRRFSVYKMNHKEKWWLSYF